jgi:raffinose/stachyose/melibiose transport system permease protein
MQAPSNPDSIVTPVGAPSGIAPAGTSRRSQARAGFEPWLYLAPGLLIFTAFMAIPTVGTLVLSATGWNGISWDTAAFIGFDNYVRAIQDGRFQTAFINNLQLIPFFVILPALLGIIPAAVSHQMRLVGARWFQAGLFLPYIMPGVLIGVVWAWILNPIFGPVNKVLKNLGFSPPTWLGDFTWALPTVGGIGAWAAYGFCYVVFIAGLQKIPRELYEAARLDGAGMWQEFRTVTLPGLRREIAVVLSINLINALRAFDVIKATTNGGPGEETQVMALYMINSAFGSNQAGYGAAIAVLLSVITLAGSMLILRFVGAPDD